MRCPVADVALSPQGVAAPHDAETAGDAIRVMNTALAQDSIISALKSIFLCA